MLHASSHLWVYANVDIKEWRNEINARCGVFLQANVLALNAGFYWPWQNSVCEIGKKFLLDNPYIVLNFLCCGTPKRGMGGVISEWHSPVHPYKSMT